MPHPTSDCRTRERPIWNVPEPWPWAALTVLLVTAVVMVRPLRARSRLRSHRFNPDDAWAVFQAGLDY